MVKFPMTSEALRVFYLLTEESHPHGTIQGGNKNVCINQKYLLYFVISAQQFSGLPNRAADEHA